MTFVVTERCIRCKYMDCVQPCPVDCFHEGPNFVVIDPDACIDCNVCAIECPVNAIYHEDELPEDQKAFVALNREFANRWPKALAQEAVPLPDRDHWATVRDKRGLLLRGD